MSRKIKQLSSVIALTFFGFMITGGLVSAPVTAATNNIPVGCPGSTVQGPPSPQDLDKCKTIPAGCPGSTSTTPPNPNLDKSTCPYSDGTFEAGAITPKTVKNDCNGPAIKAGEPDGSENHCKILDYIVDLIKLLSAVVGVVVVAMIVVGGIQYSASGDDPQAVAAAKKKIINALLALVVYIFGFALLQYLVPGGVL